MINKNKMSDYLLPSRDRSCSAAVRSRAIRSDLCLQSFSLIIFKVFTTKHLFELLSSSSQVLHTLFLLPLIWQDLTVVVWWIVLDHVAWGLPSYSQMGIVRFSSLWACKGTSLCSLRWCCLNTFFLFWTYISCCDFLHCFHSGCLSPHLLLIFLYHSYERPPLCYAQFFHFWSFFSTMTWLFAVISLVHFKDKTWLISYSWTDSYFFCFSG